MSVRWRLRVYWEDTDAGGVVYYANYLRFLERARSEWLRARGIGQAALRDEHGVVLVIRRVAVAYHRPARLDDELEVETDLTARGGASLTMAQRIRRLGEEAPLVSAEVDAACLDAHRWLPRRLPAIVVTALEGS